MFTYNEQQQIQDDSLIKEPVLTTSLEEFSKLANDIFISPYHTTVGSVIRVDKVKLALTKYLATTNNKMLNYEFIAGGEESKHDTIPELIIITGFDHDEKELPVFDHPMIIRDIRGMEKVCVDVRKYLRVLNEQPVDVLPHAKDYGSVLFIILRGLITIDFLANKQYYLCNKTVGAAYGMFISGIINSIIGLNPIDKMNIEIVASFYANMQFYRNNELHSMVDDIVGRVSTSDFSVKLQYKYVMDIISKINVEARTIDELVDNIKLVISSGKETLIDKVSILSRLSGLWFGPGDNTALGISLEHMPTWIALLTATCMDKNFKKSRLALLLEKNSRSIKPLEFSKFMDNYINTRKHEEL